MAQPLQHPRFRVVVFDRRGELLPRAEWPAYARRYAQDEPECLAREWEPPPCDSEPAP